MGQFTVAVVAAAILGTWSEPPADGVRLGGRWFEGQVRRAVQGAATRLSEPSCAAVLSDFHDGAGRSLQDRLAETALDPDAYARSIFFYDGSVDGPCRRPGVYAFTTPGSRVVRACRSLGWLAATDGARAEAVVIHELLHTLGLEEGPPTSEEITTAVERRCVSSNRPDPAATGRNDRPRFRPRPVRFGHPVRADDARPGD